MSRSEPTRRARALPGLVDPDSDDELAEWIDVPSWAEKYSVGDAVTIETPAGTCDVRVEGFSVREWTQGLPVVLVPDALQGHFADDVDTLALRETDILTGGHSDE